MTHFKHYTIESVEHTKIGSGMAQITIHENISLLTNNEEEKFLCLCLCLTRTQILILAKVVDLERKVEHKTTGEKIFSSN